MSIYKSTSRYEVAKVTWLACVLLVCLGVLGATVVWLGLLPYGTPEHQPTEFLVTASTFPPGWENSGLFTERMYELYRFAWEAASQEFDHATNRELSQNGFAQAANHIVSSYESSWLAHREYGYIVDRWFGTDDYYDPQNVKIALSYADEFRFGCIDYTNPVGERETQCRVVSRYGQYLSEFWMITKSTAVRNEEIENIMHAIENNFVEILH